MPFHCHKSPGKPSRDAELRSEEGSKKIRTSRPACSSGSTLFTCPLHSPGCCAVSGEHCVKPRPNSLSCLFYKQGARLSAHAASPQSTLVSVVLKSSPLIGHFIFLNFFSRISLPGFMSAQSKEWIPHVLIRRVSPDDFNSS